VREIRTGEEATRALRQLARPAGRAAQGKPLLRARILRLMAMIGERWRVQITEPALPSCLSEVAAAVAVSFEPCACRGGRRSCTTRLVWVTHRCAYEIAGGCPTAADLHGARCGTVLNAAVTLNGLYPVPGMAKLNTAGASACRASIWRAQRNPHHGPAARSS
jgi:hypothetical protein